MSTCSNEAAIRELQNSKFLHITEIVMLILSIGAIPVAMIALFKVSMCSIFHINTKIIAILHCVCLIVHCVGRIIQHSSDLYFWLSPLATCDKRQYFQICIVSRCLHTFGIYYSSFTSVFLTIEKTIATWDSKKYEHKTSELGVLLVIVQTIISFLITWIIFTSYPMPERPVYCALDTRLRWTTYAEVITLFVNFAAFFQCVRLHSINVKLRDNKSEQLSQKYQVEENKTSVRVLMAFTRVDLFFMVTYFLLALVLYWFSDLSEPTFYALFELIHCLPVYVVVVYIAMAKIFRKIHEEKTVHVMEVREVKKERYFEFIKEQWN